METEEAMEYGSLEIRGNVAFRDTQMRGTITEMFSNAKEFSDIAPWMSVGKLAKDFLDRVHLTS